MYNEFYAQRIAAIEAEINRTMRIAALIYSPHEACRKRAKRAEKRLAKLRDQIDVLLAAAAQEAVMDA